jgi:hypothetical protein
MLQKITKKYGGIKKREVQLFGTKKLRKNCLLAATVHSREA